MQGCTVMEELEHLFQQTDHAPRYTGSISSVHTGGVKPMAAGHRGQAVGNLLQAWNVTFDKQPASSNILPIGGALGVYNISLPYKVTRF